MSDRTRLERHNTAAYQREFMPAMLGYAIAVAVVLPMLSRVGDWKYLLALIPVIPIAFTIRAMARHVRRSDEMQRQIMLTGLSTGFGMAMVAAIATGMLAVAGADAILRWAPWIIFGAGHIGWMIGTALVNRTLR